MMPKIAWAKLSASPPFFAARNVCRSRHTVAQKAGIRYENRMQLRFKSLYPLYTPAPWIEFGVEGENDCGYIEPDGFYFNLKERELIIVEFKLSHTASAFPQLRRYKAIVEKLFPSWRIGILEVVNTFDCWVSCPIKPVVVDGFEDLNHNAFPVMLCPL